MNKEGGIYALLLALEKSHRLTIGKLGNFTFPSGCYTYVGSALGGLKPRLERHLRQEKNYHWHIDYLLPYARWLEIWYSLDRGRKECLWGKSLLTLPQAQAPVPGFGSSDCHCPSHLIYFPQLPPLPQLQSKLEAEGAKITRLCLYTPSALRLSPSFI